MCEEGGGSDGERLRAGGGPEEGAEEGAGAGH